MFRVSGLGNFRIDPGLRHLGILRWANYQRNGNIVRQRYGGLPKIKRSGRHGPCSNPRETSKLASSVHILYSTHALLILSNFCNLTKEQSTAHEPTSHRRYGRIAATRRAPESPRDIRPKKSRQRPRPQVHQLLREGRWPHREPHDRVFCQLPGERGERRRGPESPSLGPRSRSGLAWMPGYPRCTGCTSIFSPWCFLST